MPSYPLYPEHFDDCMAWVACVTNPATANVPFDRLEVFEGLPCDIRTVLSRGLCCTVLNCGRIRKIFRAISRAVKHYMECRRDGTVEEVLEYRQCSILGMKQTMADLPRHAAEIVLVSYWYWPGNGTPPDVATMIIKTTIYVPQDWAGAAGRNTDGPLTDRKLVRVLDAKQMSTLEEAEKEGYSTLRDAVTGEEYCAVADAFDDSVLSQAGQERSTVSSKIPENMLLSDATSVTVSRLSGDYYKDTRAAAEREGTELGNLYSPKKAVTEQGASAVISHLLAKYSQSHGASLVPATSAALSAFAVGSWKKLVGGDDRSTGSVTAASSRHRTKARGASTAESLVSHESDSSADEHTQVLVDLTDK